MLTETADYDQLYRNFRWDIPARFNIATACCDRHADGSGRLALIYIDEDGAARRTSFDEVADASRRFANVLKVDGLKRGDRVAVFLSQSLELPIAHMAAFRSGLVSIPLFALFGEDALEFRLANSGARVVVTDATGFEKLAKIRDRLPDLQSIYVIGDGAPAGAKSFWGSLKAASPEFTTVDTSADDPAMIIYTSGTTGNPKGALHAHRVVPGHMPNIEMCHDFFPKPDDLMWTPADWAWIGGLINALFAAWYHGVPVVGHRARKFEPQAAMQMMADHAIRNVFLPPTALKLMRQADVQATPASGCAAFLPAASRSAANCSAGSAPPSASMRTRCSARPSAIWWSAAIQNCFRSARARWASPRPVSTCASSTNRARNCRAEAAASLAYASPIR
jgi:acetyl-CoA synthetase